MAKNRLEIMVDLSFRVSLWQAFKMRLAGASAEEIVKKVEAEVSAFFRGGGKHGRAGRARRKPF